MRGSERMSKAFGYFIAVLFALQALVLSLDLIGMPPKGIIVVFLLMISYDTYALTNIRERKKEVE